jgi:hypothetical protein
MLTRGPFVLTRGPFVLTLGPFVLTRGPFVLTRGHSCMGHSWSTDPLGYVDQAQLDFKNCLYFILSS